MAIRPGSISIAPGARLGSLAISQQPKPSLSHFGHWGSGLFVTIYIAQAICGFAVGFALPFVGFPAITEMSEPCDSPCPLVRFPGAAANPEQVELRPHCPGKSLDARTQGISPISGPDSLA